MEILRAHRANKEEKRLQATALSQNINKAFIMKALNKQATEILNTYFSDGCSAVVIDVKQERVNDFLNLKHNLSNYYNITQLEETKFMIRPKIISEDF